jgi:hypothetical protein
MNASRIHRWRRFPQRDIEFRRAVYTPVVREHPSKQGRVGSPQRTPDSGDPVAVSPQTQNLTPRPEDAKVEVVATAVLCRFGNSRRLRRENGTAAASHPYPVFFAWRCRASEFENLKLSLEQNQPNRQTMKTPKTLSPLRTAV